MFNLKDFLRWSSYGPEVGQQLQLLKCYQASQGTGEVQADAVCEGQQSCAVTPQNPSYVVGL